MLRLLVIRSRLKGQPEKIQIPPLPVANQLPQILPIPQLHACLRHRERLRYFSQARRQCLVPRDRSRSQPMPSHPIHHRINRPRFRRSGSQRRQSRLKFQAPRPLQFLNVNQVIRRRRFRRHIQLPCQPHRRCAIVAPSRVGQQISRRLRAAISIPPQRFQVRPRRRSLRYPSDRQLQCRKAQPQPRILRIKLQRLLHLLPGRAILLNRQRPRRRCVMIRRAIPVRRRHLIQRGFRRHAFPEAHRRPRKVQQRPRLPRLQLHKLLPPEQRIWRPVFLRASRQYSTRCDIPCIALQNRPRRQGRPTLIPLLHQILRRRLQPLQTPPRKRPPRDKTDQDQRQRGGIESGEGHRHGTGAFEIGAIKK